MIPVILECRAQVQLHFQYRGISRQYRHQFVAHVNLKTFKPLPRAHVQMNSVGVVGTIEQIDSILGQEVKPTRSS